MNVILVIMDSLRMDHMGCYGDCYPEPPKAKTPNLDRLARESLRFRKAAPESLPTLPMRRAVHTGQRVWPFWDWTWHKGDFKGSPGWGPMQEKQDTVAELLSEAGYRTGFVTDTYHQFKPSKNFHRGFAEWHWIRGNESDPYLTGPHIPDDVVLKHMPKEVIKRRKNPANARFIERHRQYLMNVAGRRSEEDYFPAQVFRTASDWLTRNSDAEKFFLVVDSFDPHEPWTPPVNYRRMYSTDENVADVIWLPYGGRAVGKLSTREMRRAQANYAGEVTLVDRWFGHFYDTFLASGHADDTLFIMTTDHGHYLGDQGLQGKMGHPLLREVLDVPILMRDPRGRRAGKTADNLVSHTDIPATILAATKVKPKQKLDGKSLLPMLRGGKGPQRKYTLTGWGPFITIRTRKWLYNASLWGQKPLLFDLGKDPRCLHNIARKNMKLVRKMHQIGQSECDGKYPAMLREQADAALPGCTPLGKW